MIGVVILISTIVVGIFFGAVLWDCRCRRYNEGNQTGLTRERALELHRQMWSDMRIILGDCPCSSERSTFKHCWISAHKKEIPEIKDLEYIHNNCFLCEWVAQEHEHGLGTSECENLCPINWSNLTNKLINKNDFGCHGFPNTCMFGSSKNNYNDAWQTESITDILDLLEREVKE